MPCVNYKYFPLTKQMKNYKSFAKILLKMFTVLQLQVTLVFGRNVNCKGAVPIYIHITGLL